MHIKCLPLCTIFVSPKKNNYFLRIPFSSEKNAEYNTQTHIHTLAMIILTHGLWAFLRASRTGQRLLRPPIWTEQDTGIWICIAWPLHLDFLELNFDAKTLSHLVFLELSYKFEFPSSWLHSDKSWPKRECICLQLARLTNWFHCFLWGLQK